MGMGFAMFGAAAAEKFHHGHNLFFNVFRKFFTGIARIPFTEFSTPTCFVFSNPPRVSGGASVRAISPPALSPYWRGGSAHVQPGATLSLFVKSNAAFRRRYQNRIVPPIIRAPLYASADNRISSFGEILLLENSTELSH